jgi:hypothetical protein
VYETGERVLALDGKNTVIEALSGQTVEKNDVREIVLDDRLRIRAREPLRMRYRSSTRPERARVTDRLYLNVLDVERAWEAGETLSVYDAVVESR